MENSNHLFQVDREQEIVYQVDVQRAAASVLHHTAQAGFLRKKCLFLPEEGEQDNQPGNGHRESGDIAIDVEQVKERNLQEEEQDAAGQQPLAVQPTLDGVKMLLQQRAQDKENEIVPMHEAEELQDVIRDGYGIHDRRP